MFYSKMELVKNESFKLMGPEPVTIINMPNVIGIHETQHKQSFDFSRGARLVHTKQVITKLPKKIF